MTDYRDPEWVWDPELPYSPELDYYRSYLVFCEEMRGRLKNDRDTGTANRKTEAQVSRRVRTTAKPPTGER